MPGRYEWQQNAKGNWLFPEEDGLKIVYTNRSGLWFGMKSPYGFLDGTYESAEKCKEVFEKTKDLDLIRNHSWEKCKNGTLKLRDDFTEWFIKQLKDSSGDTVYKIVHDKKILSGAFKDVEEAKTFVKESIDEWREHHNDFRSYEKTF